MMTYFENPTQRKRNLASGERRGKNPGPIGGASRERFTGETSPDIHAECRYG